MINPTDNLPTEISCATCGLTFSLGTQKTKRFCSKKCRLKESSLRWAREHPERMRAASERYRQKHRNKVKIYMKQYKKLHPEKIREQKRRWGKRYPAKVAAAKRRNKTRKTVDAIVNLAEKTQKQVEFQQMKEHAMRQRRLLVQKELDSELEE